MVSVISLAAIWIDLAILASIVSFGALVAFSAVNLTVIKHYFIDRGDGRRGLFNNLVLPLIGFGLTVWLWSSLSGFTLVVGLIWLRSDSSGCCSRDPRVPTADAGARDGGVAGLLGQ